MDLTQFVSDSLQQIVMGVTDAQIQLAKIAGSGSLAVNPKPILANDAIKVVDFDVAVTVTDNVTGSAEGKAGISVLGISGEIEKQKSNSQVSRIKFQVPIRFGHFHG